MTLQKEFLEWKVLSNAVCHVSITMAIANTNLLHQYILNMPIIKLTAFSISMLRLSAGN